MALGFPGDPAGRVFVQQRAFPSRRIRSDGQGVIAGRTGRIRPMRALCGRRAGPVQRPGRWLLGFGPRRAAPGVPRVELARGPDEQYRLEFFLFIFRSFLNMFLMYLIRI